MNTEPPIWLGCGMFAILVALILLAIAVCSGAFGGQSDIDIFRSYVEGGLE
jgi:hypothetical protein